MLSTLFLNSFAVGFEVGVLLQDGLELFLGEGNLVVGKVVEIQSCDGKISNGNFGATHELSLGTDLIDLLQVSRKSLFENIFDELILIFGEVGLVDRGEDIVVSITLLVTFEGLHSILRIIAMLLAKESEDCK